MDINNRLKSTLKGKITRLETYIETVKTETEIDIVELKVKLKNVTFLQKNIDELRGNYYAIPNVKEAEIVTIDEELNQMDERLEKLEVRMETVINSSCMKSSETVVNKINNDALDKFEIKTKIPPLVLPEFSGKYEEFSSFKAQFDDLITNNIQLSQSQKLYYLRSCLTHDARDLSSNFDNFESLYEALVTRYDNERLIVDIHVQNILKFEKIQSESAKEIRNMIDCIQKNLRALKALKYEQNKLSDVLLINILIQKLDKESRKSFELFHVSNNVPTFEQFIKFLEQRESVLLSINRNIASGNAKNSTNKNLPNFTNKSSKAFMINENKRKSCVVCKKSVHPIFRCHTFLNLSIEERLKLIRLHKICDLCLKMNHKKYECYSQYKCVCGARHNKLICESGDSTKTVSTECAKENGKVNKTFESPHDKDSTSQSNASVLSNCGKRKNILFSTAEIYLHTANNQRIKIRAILDSASNVCVLSKKISNSLGLKKQKIKTPVSGLNGLWQNIEWKVKTFISNEDRSFNEQVEFLIVDEITELNPSQTLDITNVEIPQFLNLADKSFYEANEINALISADIFFKVLKHNTYKVNEEFFFKESQFGWIACGKLQEKEVSKQNQFFLARNDTLQDTLKHFFDLEGLGIRDDPVSNEKDQAMEIFNETVEFKNDRYVVHLSFRKSYDELSNNYSLAKQRFQNLWRRFSHDPELHQQYREIIRDYVEQGIIEEVKDNIKVNESNKPLYYLPHQAVRKEGRLTSKTRIVFDAGSHQNNELSLNDCLWPGKNLNPNLLDLLIDFRLNKTAVCSDIKQAFLQICLAEEHKDAARFFWSNEEPCVHKKPKLHVYRFNRVNFGVSSSPFLLAATIRHHIEKYINDYPDTVLLLDKCFYVDDLISGGKDFEEALQLSRSAKNIMEAAGMDLRKWISNDANLMEQWKKEKFDVYPVDKTISLGVNTTKVLGLSWETHEDYLKMDTRSLLEFVSIDKNTKRFILQAVGRIFDPLGLITPFTIRVKCLIQDLWSEKIPWDDPLPPHIEREWKRWCEELPHLENLKIPRLVLDSTLDEDIIELHSFCDASKKAYGAAIYLKSRTRNGISVKLVTSKSRVAPLNGVTLPRLELLGALIAARLTFKVGKILNSKRSCVQYHWTDSKIVLFWIKGSKTRWKQFVANRVNEITSLTDPNSWYHCAGKENPADLLSRGVSADCLVTSNTRWWTGAEFLSDPKFPENFQSVDSDLDYLTENEKETIVFISNCRNKVKRPEPLTVEEIRNTENKLIQHAQISLFDKKGLPSNISNLFPFVDEEGIVRVGGRLENASVPYPHKHPAILPKGSKLSKIYFESLHRRLFHVGPLGLLNAVRLKFWPLSGRSIARKTVHQCVTCFKSRPILSSQIMGNLPSERVNISSPFTITGLDLCGPYLVKYKNQRNGTLNKVYICVCICFSTKAIHLELLSDLTSDALIATLKRFTSRRGRCSKIYTDNATNFVGSNSKLKKFYKLINFPDENLANYFTSEGIDWNFIPPKSPHFGGLWEAGVKSVKHHLKRTIGNLHFTYEEFETIMIQTEGILNSRPLTPLSSDEDNFDVLTPGHDFRGRPISSIPEPFLTDINENRLSRWQKTTKVVQLIWKKWKSDYLNTLQARSKWMAEKDDLIIGQMVLIKDDFLPINNWLLGRILEVYYGSDGKVRVVKVRTKSGNFKRTINKIAVLPIDTS
ncbi:hypothetical protein AVEN_191071-1 [Araneus ventricosus]|uniref:Integrase catalytic domain-containing protein n=1 Tax=Araneus ventricosus TaxID=182803 RepID=A0A4Y2AZZ5_ARAVE|nr:hypothetical protein AVEN_191071-1 [Araneus ventricosus]